MSIPCFKTRANELLTNNAYPGPIPAASHKEAIMKKILLTAVVAVVVMFMAGSAFAASQSANVPITATVGATACKAIAAGTLSLLVSDVSDTVTPVNSTGVATTIQCQNGQASTTITASSLNAGGAPTSVSPLAGMLVNGPDTLAYSLTFATSITGIGYGGSGKNLTLINAGAATTTPTGNEPAGVYTDTVTITVNY